MAFGKNLCQNDEKYTPRPNNYCGGFAMSAILADLNDGIDPIEVYDEIQEIQKDVKSGPLYGIIEQMKELGNGTNICLPSSMVKMAQEAGFKVDLKYSGELGFNDAEIKADLGRCGMGGKDKESKETVIGCFSDKDIKYYLVLVNNCHWIAVKRKTKGDGFSVYDPGSGANNKFATYQGMILDWKESKYSGIGALIITLKPLAQ